MPKSPGPARRAFLKSAVAAAGIPALAAGAAEQAASTPAKPVPPAPSRSPGSGARGAGDYCLPAQLRGRQLACIAFPLGGVCAGSLSLGGRGQLRDWEIFNRPDKGRTPEYAFPASGSQIGGRKPVARVLEARIPPPYEGSSRTRHATTLPGSRRLQSATFTGEFPLAQIDFRDPAAAR